MDSEVGDSSTKTSLGVKPEHLELNSWIAITIAPSNSYQPDLSEKQIDLHRFSRDWRNRFRKCINHIQVFGEYSQGSRWHFHGRVKVTNPVQFYMYDLPFLRKISMVHLDVINDPMEWDLYCRKLSITYDGEFLRPLALEGLDIKYDNRVYFKREVLERDTKVIHQF